MVECLVQNIILNNAHHAVNNVYVFLYCNMCNNDCGYTIEVHGLLCR